MGLVLKVLRVRVGARGAGAKSATGASGGRAKGAKDAARVAPPLAPAPIAPTRTFSTSSTDTIRLRGRRIGLVRIDAEIRDGLLHDLGFDLPFLEQLGQRRDGDEPRVDFEELAQRGAVFAPAEAVGAERADPARHPAVDRVREDLAVVGG